MAQKRETIYRPAKGPSPTDYPSWETLTNGFYLVTHGHEVAYAYFGSYYTVGEVISDVITRNEYDRTSLTGEWASMDFVVWHDTRIMAAIHEPIDDEIGAFRVVRFDEG